MSKISFKNREITIPKVLTSGEKYLIEFEFEGDPSEIIRIQPGCGCTADCKVVGNKITAMYTADQKNSSTGSSKYEFNKSIRVFTKDDKDLWITENMNKKLNLSYNNTVLVFKGIIENK